MNSRVSIIAAIGKNREIGKRGELIWRVSDDLKRVKALTMGHPIIMGRKTYESIGRPLQGRTNIVVSGNKAAIPGCYVARSFGRALELAETCPGADEIFLFGGEKIYRAGIRQATRLYLTIFDATDSEADTFFPPYENFTKVISRESRQEGSLRYEWVTLEC